MSAPIGQINLALAGKIDFVKKTNPYGSSEEEEEARKLRDAPSNPEFAMKTLVGLVKTRQGNAPRKPKRAPKPT